MHAGLKKLMINTHRSYIQMMIHACLHTNHIHISTCIHKYYIHTCIHIHTRIHAYIHAFTRNERNKTASNAPLLTLVRSRLHWAEQHRCKCTFLHKYMYVCMYVCMCVCIFVYSKHGVHGVERIEPHCAYVIENMKLRPKCALCCIRAQAM
jgi:hypothetical protein